MKKLFKITAFIILVLSIVLTAFLYFTSKPLPKGETGSKAEVLTDKIQEAINQKAWDATAAVSFSFMDSHHYIWDKKNNLVQVKWGDKKVVYNTKTKEGMAYDDNKILVDDAKTDAIVTANKYFNNDSFWLIAPFKLRDAGTARSIVMQDNHEALMVTYNMGGSTPGDSYVWLIDDNYVPTAWRMWVGIIPMGGVETSWADWIVFPNGVKIATKHNILFDVKLENVKIGRSIEEINNGANPFTDLMKN
jgi:uncharacterized protein YpmB